MRLPVVTRVDPSHLDWRPVLSGNRLRVKLPYTGRAGVAGSIVGIDEDAEIPYR